MKTFAVIFLVGCAALAVTGKKLRLASGAEKADDGEFPYQVSIQLNGQHYCGGALISKTHVLTAAHCVYDFIHDPTDANTKARALVVAVGSNSINGGVKHAVKRVSHKRDFDRSPQSSYFMPNDIGVITLKTPVTLSDKVKIIDLPTANSEVPIGSEMVISGYGTAVVGGSLSPVLQKTQLDAVSQQECNQYYTATFGKAITSSHLCAKHGRTFGVCKGDSGGPLVYKNKVVGVVSGGNGKCGNGDPDIFTKVSHFIPYIEYEMKYDFSKPPQPVQPNGHAKAVIFDDKATSQTQTQTQTQTQQQQQQQTLPFYPIYPQQQQQQQQFYPPGQLVILPYPRLGVQYVDPNTGYPIVG